IQEERDKCHREADMLEAHIMQAQAAAMAADEKDLQSVHEECDQYQSLGLPPGKSNLRNCLDAQLLRKFHLIVPEDFTSDGSQSTKPPKADDIPSYARCTTSSQQRYRKTPPLTDYMDDMTSSLGYTSLTYERRPVESPALLTDKTKSTSSKVASWKDSMKPSQRQVEREDLQRLKSKSEYKRNPRFVPPRTADLIQAKSKDSSRTKEKESSCTPSIIFIATPSPLVFTHYKVGEVYELSIELKNVTSSSRQVRAVPPSTKHFSVGLGRFPSENGIVAPGMSCVYSIRFSPDSLADYDDIIKVKTQVEPSMDICLQGRRPPPQLSLTGILSCGHTLVGGTKVVHFTCTNMGGDGQFCVMSKDTWPMTDFKWSLDDPGAVNMPPFVFKPAMFELRNGESIDLEPTKKHYEISRGGSGYEDVLHFLDPSQALRDEFRDFSWSVWVQGCLVLPSSQASEKNRDFSWRVWVTFCPTGAKFFTQDMVMVCDNCHVKVFSLEGTGQMAGIQFMSVSGGISDYNVGELKDSSSQYLIRFDDQNPNTQREKELTIKNTTNVALPFRWKLFKPCFRGHVTGASRVPTGQQSFNRVQRTPDEDGVIRVIPNMGTLPPHQIVHFSLEHCPRKIGSFHSVAHLVLEEIPVHGVDHTTSVSRDHTTSVSRDVTAIEIEVKANSQPFNIQVSPATLSIPGTLALGTTYQYVVKMQNHSVSDAEVTWNDVTSEACRIEMTPENIVLAPNESRELTVSLTGYTPGTVEKTLFCHVDHLSEPVYLHVRALFEGPEVMIDAMDLDLGLVPLGESATRQLSITNQSNITTDWNIEECSDCRFAIRDDNKDEDFSSEFVFIPCSGSLSPGEVAMVTVTFTPAQCRRVRTVFQCQAKNGKTSYLSVFSEVQTPLACLLSSCLYIEDVYLDVPVSRTITLHNQTLMVTKFDWNQVMIGGVTDSDYTVTFEPTCGELHSRQALPIRVTFTGHKKGQVDNLMTSCHVTGMDKPVWLTITTDVRGLNVTFETPKMLENQTPDEIKKVDLNTPQLLDFGVVCLGDVATTTLVMTNTTAIRARYSIHVQHFTAAKPPTPPDGKQKPCQLHVYGRRRQSLLIRTPNIANPLSKTVIKAHTDHVSATLRNGRGAAFVATPSSGELLPFGYQVVEITAYNDMWGDYRDLLVCLVEGLDPVYIPIQMSSVGCPLNYQMTKDQSPVLRFGTHISGATPVTRSLRVNNTSPYDIRLDWSTYNTDDDDTQLLDMLVWYGQPLPVLNREGQELPPPPPLCDLPCFMPPFIQVKLREHEGIRCNKPFEVTPSQQVIPSKGHASMSVTFTPHTTNPLGQICTAFAAAYMSLDGPHKSPLPVKTGIDITIPGRVERHQGMDMTRFRLDITANINPALLSIEMDEDEGCHFTTAASDLLSGSAMKVHRFVLSNTTETPLSLGVAVGAPFKVISTEPPPSAKSTRSQANGLATIKPGKNIEVKVGFDLTKQLLSRVHELPANDELDGCFLAVTDTGQRTMTFKTDLVVEFSNKTTQVLPLSGSIAVPTLRLSKYELDFGMCLVGQEKELQVVVSNPTESMSAWVAEKDPRCPDVSRDVFSVSPAQGLLEAYTSHVSKNKLLIRITFVA
ncbi:hypothetical protein QZH41_019666, partial [Actinostola sp. cb2023]